MNNKDVEGLKRHVHGLNPNDREAVQHVIDNYHSGDDMYEIFNRALYGIEEKQKNARKREMYTGDPGTFASLVKKIKKAAK